MTYFKLSDLVLQTLKNNAELLGFDSENIILAGSELLPPCIHVSIYPIPDSEVSSQRFMTFKVQIDVYATAVGFENESESIKQAMIYANNIASTLGQNISDLTLRGFRFVAQVDKTGQIVFSDKTIICIELETMCNVEFYDGND